ncbi:hypothetical protein B0T19DRAFT_441458 [Cercophora scortea]|uniref:Uncharacterized protein n=1 Tax=Cercophora scortea TaxID=314031 RepID=A0AAE0MCH0_9PEZI|nr:hypothetical protein B0T19DRAFT_441458 [Cercophora scortea]
MQEHEAALLGFFCGVAIGLALNGLANWCLRKPIQPDEVSQSSRAITKLVIFTPYDPPHERF